MRISRVFWLLTNVLLAIFHIAVIYLLLSGQASLFSPVGLGWMLLILLHLFEIPLAFLATQLRPSSAVVTVLFTILFGFTWWLPVKLGIYGISPIQR